VQKKLGNNVDAPEFQKKQRKFQTFNLWQPGVEQLLCYADLLIPRETKKTKVFNYGNIDPVQKKLGNNAGAPEFQKKQRKFQTFNLWQPGVEQLLCYADLLIPRETKKTKVFNYGNIDPVQKKLGNNAGAPEFQTSDF
jgi:hypothetical protein